MGADPRMLPEQPTRMPHPRVLFIEACDFETFPVGGQLSMARSLIKVFGESLALVGMSRGDHPVGRWFRKEINGTSYWFFPACRKNLSAKRPVIPARLTFYLGLQRYRSRILSLGSRSALIGAPEALLATSHWGFESLCFIFPGVENPLKISRYPIARSLSPVFDRSLFSALDRVSVILACADEEAIDRLVLRSKGQVGRERIIQLPTFVDLSEFHPRPMREVRASLGIPTNSTVFATSGRIAEFKGWKLLLDAFSIFHQKYPDSFLIFVGDGEDRPLVEAAIAARNIGSRVRITGFQGPSGVSGYLNAADVYVCGSLVEGWSVAMLEALACGKPIVSTPVSGANQMIVPRKNGFIVPTRNPVDFSRAIESALGLSDAEKQSRAIADHFSLRRLGERLGYLWPPLRPNSLDFASDGRIGQLLNSDHKSADRLQRVTEL